MTTKIITVSVNSEVEQRFRRTARAVHGKRKGYLGKALTDAMETWTREKSESNTVAGTLSLLERGVNLGGIKYKVRDELHEK